MFYVSSAFIISIFLCHFTSLLSHRADGDPCESLANTPFAICRNAGYEAMVPYPQDVTEASKEEFAAEMKHAIEPMRNASCAPSSVVDAIECSLFAPKCNSLGDPIYPCRQVCAEYLKQCEHELNDFDLQELIPHCLLFPNATSGCTECFFPPNFTTSNNSEPGPLDQGCVELIFPACKNLGLYTHTLSSLIVQEDQYEWFYDKEYTEDKPATEFPHSVQEMLNLYPKCAVNIKKLFCGQHFPPCFPDEGLRLYTLCQPLCDAIARDCPEFFRHNLPGAVYCGTMAKGKSVHGFCPSTHLPDEFNWLPYAEATRRPRVTMTKVSVMAAAAVKSHKTQAWAISVTVLLSVVVVGILVWLALCWKMPHVATPAYLKQYKRQTNVDLRPLDSRNDLA